MQSKDSPPGYVIACPDCCAERLDGLLRHDPTCPLGRATDRTCAADTAWFVANPGTAERWRPPYPGEVAELLAGCDVWPHRSARRRARIRVRDLGDGRLVRELWINGQPLGGVVDVPGESGWAA